MNLKKIFLISTLVCFFYINTYAQALIAVQNGGTPAFYTVLDSAITHAQNGDTIYIPGGTFTLNTYISKSLHVNGVGHNPDSTNITGPTIIVLSFNLANGASGGSLNGVKLLGDFSFGNATINNYIVSRCFISGNITSNTNQPANNVFYENIIGAISLQYAQSNAFYNNIVHGYNENIGAGNIFKNNVFMPGGGYVFKNTTNSIFMNNIFRCLLNTINSTNVTNNIFNNNLFVENFDPGSNNIFNQAQSSIFINQNSNYFDYTQDYHIQPSCPGINAGTDGTDIGIYGGLFPWKDGSLPLNPHIQSKNISGTTDVNGNLNVNIKVQAQDK